ncbi:MAG: CvpA family protein [Proteobacteria bacterium]|nr:CvpA family protein [Pseudomonadota bacterium]
MQVGNLGWIDIALLAFLLLSVLFGLVRGLVFEVLSLVGWVVAWFIAQAITPALAPYVHLGTAGSPLNRIVTFACAFIVVLVLWGLAARLLRMVVRATPLSPVDRLLGAGFGLARGVLVLMLVAIGVALTPLREAPAWQASEGATWLYAAIQGLRPWLPPDWSLHLPA